MAEVGVLLLEVRGLVEAGLDLRDNLKQQNLGKIIYTGVAGFVA